LVAGALKNHPALARLLPEDLAQEVAMDIGNWLVEDPPISPLEGGLVPEGADAALDRLKNLANDGKGAIARMEAELKEETGINSLKIKHVTNMGYVIDITRANLDRVPKSWLRKQTISTGERYYTLELKEYEEQVTGASEKAIQLEYRLFCALRERVAETVPRLCALARGVAEIDALCAFAEAAVRNRYVRPVFAERNEVDIRGGRHPVVEALNREERFVPNDIRLEAAAPMMILTGPNMAGKSTLMRQVALLVVMAQAGAFVPAQAARIGICDRIFVRVGASDDLSRGQSTFMVEMSETAFILGNATENSLVLLDEIGRGTSTYDGLSIAWAVAEDLHDRVKCRVIFATHYHELSALRESCARIRNMHVSVSEQGDKIVFLRRLKEGPASSSYGIQCAQLAGLPLRVVKRARSVLQTLEARRPRPEPTQLSLFGGGPEPEPQAIEEPPAPLEDPIRSFLGELDPDSLSPRDAMAALYKLKGMLDVQ
jgi:DNA mismatch repair protein MutS